MPATAEPDERAALRAATDAGRRAAESASRRHPTARVELVEAHPFGERSIVERYRLHNGLDILLLQDHTAPVVAYQKWFRVGSRHERPGLTGMAHLFEHLMFKGTAKYPEGELDRLLENAGVSNNASTWLDWTYYRENLPAGALPLVVELEADRMSNLLLTPEQLEPERAVVMNERNLRVENDPEGRISETLYGLAFREHPYGRPTIGWMEDIQAITLEDCFEFYQNYYCPGNATVVIVGDVDREATLGLLLDHYGSIPGRDVPVENIVDEPAQESERRETLVLPIASPKLVVAFRSPRLVDPDLPALELANEVLFNGESARLHRMLVLERELASYAGGWVAGFTHPGLYETLYTLKPDGDVDEVEGLVYEELERLATDGPTPREIEKARNKLETELARSVLTVGSRARVIGSYEATTGDFKNFFRIVQAYREVDADDVRRVCAKVLRPESRTVVVALPSQTGEGASEGEGA